MDEPEAREARSPLSAWKELAVVSAFVALLVGAGLWWAAATTGLGASRIVPVTRSGGVPPPLDDYVGARACRDCHPGESAHHDRSGHARTLRPGSVPDVARRLDGQAADDPEYPGASWSYALRDGRLIAERSEGGHASAFPLDYVLGSGHHALTFVGLAGRDEAGRPLGLEHRMTYFADRSKLDVTPGQHRETHIGGGAPEGRHLNADETRTCLNCHATRAARDRPGVLDPASMIANVSCERCHGPGRAHVEAARRGESVIGMSLPFGHGAESAEAQIRLCGQCHRLPEFVPPEDIRPETARLARFQPVGLMQSKCYIEGGGRMSCTTCHDPHARTSRDRPAYEAACLSCHRETSKADCPVSPTTGCLDCHMPRRDTGNGLVFTDHWIRIIRTK